jgi:TonB family protein
MPSTPHRRTERASLVPFSIAIWFVVVMASSAAIAQVAAPLIPPIAAGSTDVPYPSNASGDAVVLIELVVENDGTVSSAQVMEGAEPFAKQARAAVLAWRFAPARRGDTPVAARIRARVEFHQDNAQDASISDRASARGIAALPGTPASGAAVSSRTTPPVGPISAQAASQVATPKVPAPTTPVPEAPLDVTVRGTRHEIGQTTLSASDVREMPGAFGDPFRAIGALPGVVPMRSELPYFYIRGAPPNDNGYYIDGIRVPLLFHVGVGEGVIHPALIDHVDFFPGAAPASYGGFAGATIAGQTREPAGTPHGEANVRVIDAGALLEAPLEGGRGSVLAAARYGYPGPIISAITPNLKLDYWDYQTRATRRISDQDTLGIFAFGSHDYIAKLQPGSPTSIGGGNLRTIDTLQELLASDFHRIDLRWDHVFANGNGHVRVAATVGYDSQGAAPTYATDYSAATRLQIDAKLSQTVRVRGGAEARYDDYGFKQGSPVQGGENYPSTANPPPTNVMVGAHADVVWRPSPRIEIVAGARFDLFQSERATAPGATTQVNTSVPAFDPRLSARVTLTDSVAWLSTFGLSHQYPTLRVGSIPPSEVSVPGFPFGVAQLQTVAQASQGVEVALPAEITATATGFFSDWSGLTDLTANCVQLSPPDGPYTCPNDVPVHGRAYGLELLVRRPLSRRLTGWLSYTLSRSTRDAHFITPSGSEATATIVGDYDRTHVLNAAAAYDLGRRWRFGARFVFYTGLPYSTELPPSFIPVPPLNNQRYQPFYRVDVRLEKRWSFKNNRSIAFVAEVLNATLSKEEYGSSCNLTNIGGSSTTTCQKNELGPVTLPSVGVEASF